MQKLNWPWSDLQHRTYNSNDVILPEFMLLNFNVCLFCDPLFIMKLLLDVYGYVYISKNDYSKHTTI